MPWFLGVSQVDYYTKRLWFVLWLIFDMVFHYFAYGSNLLSQRIRISNPSAVKVAVAKLDNFQLYFGGYGERWHGAVASIRAATDSHVWGVVWQLDDSHMQSLDRQEGVHCGQYTPLTVTTVSESGAQYSCRSYQLLSNVACLPSVVYQRVIVAGALEHGLCDSYVQWLCSLENNSYSGPVDVEMDFDKLPPLKKLAESAAVNGSDKTRTRQC